MTSASWRALGTTVVVAVTEAPALRQSCSVVATELDAIDRACSRFRDDSELVRLNARAGMSTRVGSLLFEALRTAVDAAAATGGLVDPTVGRSLRLSGYDETFSVVRGRDGTLRPSFVRVPGWRTIELDGQTQTVRVPKGVELDLGATAKALAADRAARLVHEATGVGALVSLGGDIAVAGAPPGEGWTVRIADDSAAPLDSTGPCVLLSTGGLATSGTTVRRWKTSAGELHHLVDPRTGRPAPSLWRTATVTAASCVDANTASTAAVVLGEHAPRWLATAGLPARLVRYDDAVSRVAGWPEAA
jgi:thiamine biosynthesis lipoprotein